MVICVYAPDSARDFEKYPKFMGELTKVLQEGRKEGARRFFVAGDMGTEFGCLCMDHDEEMQNMYGPQCWYGNDADPGGFKKTT